MNKEKFKTLFNLLAINQKIREEPLRFLYLKEVWGIEQTYIAHIEECSQAHVSNVLTKIKMDTSVKQMMDEVDIQFTADEIRYIQFLPREIIRDIEVIAFVNNVLGLAVIHPFYQHFDHTVNMRIAALGNMGIQNKYLVKWFKKTQPTISMIVKRNAERLDVERYNRYDSTAKFALGVQKDKSNFILAGGQDV